MRRKDNLLITKQEFVFKIRERDRRSKRAALVMIILLVVAPLGIGVIDYAKTHHHLDWSGNVDVMKVYLVLWLITFIPAFIWMIVLGVRDAVTCPHCKRQFQPITAQITVATGFCGFCGEQVFEQSYKKA